ncbi:hypothetical protein [Streptomyces sp. RFCAC02]|uniref:hypothetical protein n=1 Tax=Streptomyces sp. RFCAC02 TaxID=2499143 RepID=UPI00101F9F60|nr:hypothetical protein [Streptomyces sp. RFCAC02]
MTDRDPGRPARGTRWPEPGAEAPDGPGPPGDTGAPGGEDGEDGEEALRRLLRDAVDGIGDPSADALDHLRSAVAARRRRRKQFLVGTAASLALLGIGAPVVLSATGAVGGSGTHTVSGPEGDSAFDGTRDLDGLPGAAGPYPPDGLPLPSDEPRADPGGTGRSPEDQAGGAAGGVESDDGVSSPTCDRDQLGSVHTVAGTPDDQGRVYGFIRMVNVSDDACRVTGDDELSALPLAAGDMSATAQVQVLDRTEGDRAVGLPTPDETLEELVLSPGRAYEIQFAWVPSSGTAASCAVAAEPAAGTSDGGLTTELGGTAPLAGTPDSTTTTQTAGTGTDTTGTESATDDPSAPGDTDGTSDGSGTTDPTTPGDSDGTSDGSGSTDPTAPGDGDGTDEPTTGGTDGDGTDDGTTDGVLLRYTPAAGEPEAARILLAGTCSGTVYRTGVLEAPAS